MGLIQIASKINWPCDFKEQHEQIVSDLHASFDESSSKQFLSLLNDSRIINRVVGYKQDVDASSGLARVTIGYVGFIVFDNWEKLYELHAHKFKGKSSFDAFQKKVKPAGEYDASTFGVGVSLDICKNNSDLVLDSLRYWSVPSFMMVDDSTFLSNQQKNFDMHFQKYDSKMKEPVYFVKR